MSSVSTPIPPANPNRAVDVALAEFNALRAEIVARATAQAAITGVGLVALGVLLGSVLQKGGDARLLYGIPPLALLISLLDAGETYRVASIGRYLQHTLWPYLQSEVGNVPSWEDFSARRKRKWFAIPLAILLDGPTPAFFIAASLVALGAAPPSPTLQPIGWSLTGAAIVVPLIAGLLVLRAKKGSKAATTGKAADADAE